MSPLRRGLLIAGLGGLAAGAGVLAHLWRLGVVSSAVVPEVGDTILSHRFQQLDGSQQTLEHLRGAVLVVNFWATWCAPCREEIPVFVRLQQEYAAKNLHFVGISIDQADKVSEFAREFRINYPLVIAGMDGVELSRRAGNKAGVLPYTALLDRKGRLAGTLLGGVDEVRLRAAINPLI
jgi:thiol-disulfide isomerase/thioredoxin